METANHHLWRRFLALAAPYWREDEKWSARGLLALLAILILGLTEFAVRFNEQTGEFTSALAARDADRFWAAIRYCLGLLLAAAPTYALYYYVRDRLGINWRRWLTRRFLDRYFSHRRFYELNAVVGIDNPDQRVAEDIATFTQRSLYYLLIVISSIIQLVAFSGVLWSISRELVHILVAYALLGTFLVVFVFGRRLMKLNFHQLRREADFRFGLVRVRENAEPIAFYRGEGQEEEQAMRRFAKAFANYLLLIRRQFSLNLFQHAYSLLTLIIPSIVLAEQVLSGEIEVGRAVQAGGAFLAVLGAVSLIVENFEGLSRFAAGVDRLDSLSKALPEQDGAEVSRPADCCVIRTVEAPRVALENLTLHTPNHERILIRDLSLAVESGQGLMIVGESGCGKSSLLRAIAGLWRSGSGTIYRPRAQDILFLPQQPYMLLGTLRSQLLYPNQARPVGDDELLRLLQAVNLPDLADRCGGLDAELDWHKVLSIGEQQRLAFARLLLARPRYAILDEATSALDAANEAALYRRLVDSGATPISVSHRSTLLPYHATVLELRGDGGWATHAAADYRFGH